jgi:hypothetical protein
MSRRASFDKQQKTIHYLQTQINRLHSINNHYKKLLDVKEQIQSAYLFFKKEKRQEYERLKNKRTVVVLFFSPQC